VSEEAVHSCGGASKMPTHTQTHTHTHTLTHSHTRTHTHTHTPASVTRGLHARITVTTKCTKFVDQYIMLVRIYYIRACTPGSRSRRHSERPWTSRTPAQNWLLYIKTYFGLMCAFRKTFLQIGQAQRPYRSP